MERHPPGALDGGLVRRSQTKDHPPRRHLIDRGRALHHRDWMAGVGGHDRGAERDPLGPRQGRADEHGKRIRSRTADRQPGGVEPVAVGRHDAVDQRGRAHHLDVLQGDVDADAHVLHVGAPVFDWSFREDRPRPVPSPRSEGDLCITLPLPLAGGGAEGGGGPAQPVLILSRSSRDPLSHSVTAPPARGSGFTRRSPREAGTEIPTRRPPRARSRSASPRPRHRRTACQRCRGRATGRRRGPRRVARSWRWSCPSLRAAC